jgi:hypothetical protein
MYMIYCSLTANATIVPPYVETPAEGEYKMGGEDGITDKDGHLRLGTDFYIYIENPTSEESTEPNGDPILEKAPPTDSTTETEQDDKNPNASPSDGETESGNQEESSSEAGGAASKNGSLPKTGDYGLNKNQFLLASLLFGAGYLVCDGYEKKNEEKE